MTVEVAALEISVDDEIGGAAVGCDSDVVNGQSLSVGVFFGDDGEVVAACVGEEDDCEGGYIVVNRRDGAYDLTIPVDISLAAGEVCSRDWCVVEREGEGGRGRLLLDVVLSVEVEILGDVCVCGLVQLHHLS